MAAAVLRVQPSPIEARDRLSAHLEAEFATPKPSHTVRPDSAPACACDSAGETSGCHLNFNDFTGFMEAACSKCARQSKRLIHAVNMVQSAQVRKAFSRRATLSNRTAAKQNSPDWPKRSIHLYPKSKAQQGFDAALTWTQASLAYYLFFTEKYT